MNKTSVIFTCMIPVFSVATAFSSAPPAKLALQGARIIPVEGQEIARGTVLIENGKITAIGEEVEIPYDAMVVDVSGKVLFPGMVDPHSARALDIPNENLPVTPFLDVYDALDPSKAYFEDALRDGVTAVHVIVGNNCVIGGLSRVVNPIGMSPDEMTIAAPVAMKLSVAPKRGSGRMVQMATLRETFLELADYLERLAEKKYEESLEEKGELLEVGPKEARRLGKDLIRPDDYDDKHRSLVKLTSGKLLAFVYCGTASDVAQAITLAKENGFFDRMTLVLGPDCFKAIDEIKASKRPVILDSELIYRETDPLTGEIRETFVPKVFSDALVKFSLQPSPSNSLAERYLNYQAARCVRHGIRRRKALKSITVNPAKAAGVGDRVGSLKVGKSGDIVVFSGDPLDFNSWVEQVYIRGILAYDRKDDVRLKRLLGDEPAEVSTAADDSSAEQPNGEGTNKSGRKTEE
ncbi:MAG: amidohydrolase family protein [Planctomycetes bacterium]|nr:amidohydrolase family protein [Planctomycetota bacterium]